MRFQHRPAEESDAFATRQAPWSTLLLLATMCSVLALLRAGESLAHRDTISWTEVLVALRWRLWDWWFWIPAAVVAWRMKASIVVRRPLTWSLMVRHVAIAVMVLVVHRAWSLLGMLLFYPGASLSMMVTHHLVGIAPSLAMMDVLAWSALMSASCAAHLAVARRQRLRRRRLRRASVPAPAAATSPVQRLLVRVGRRQELINLADIAWCEADGYCTRLHTSHGSTHVARVTMAWLEQSVDPAAFVRVHRSVIVRVGDIRELQQAPDGSHAVRLHNGKVLPVSRARYGSLRRRLADRAAT